MIKKKTPTTPKSKPQAEPKPNPWDRVEVNWKDQVHIINQAQLATICAMYQEMCKAEEDGEVGSHYHLVNALNAAGIMGVNKENARRLGAQLC